MGCEVAILSFSQCGHRRLYKLGCTKPDCGEGKRCPPDQRTVVLSTRYLWRCEGCTERYCDEMGVARASEWDERHGNLKASGLTPNLQDAFERLARKGRSRDSRKQHLKTEKLMEESYGAELWTVTYGQSLRAFKYSSQVDLNNEELLQSQWWDKKLPDLIVEEYLLGDVANLYQAQRASHLVHARMQISRPEARTMPEEEDNAPESRPVLAFSTQTEVQAGGGNAEESDIVMGNLVDGGFKIPLRPSTRLASSRALATDEEYESRSSEPTSSSTEGRSKTPSEGSEDHQ